MQTDPAVGDAFGRALLDRLEQGPGAGGHVIERDDGFVEVASADMYFGTGADWSAVEVEAAARAFGHVVDLGAGAGRHSLAMQERGLEVTAVDHSPGAVDVCRRRGVTTAIIGTAAELDQGRFDTVALFGNNFGMLGSARGAAVMLRELARITRPGAIVIGSALDPYRTEASHHLAYHARNLGLGRWAGQTTLRVRYLDMASPWFDWLLVSVDELRSLLDGSGWRLIEIIGDSGPIYAPVLQR